MTEPRKPHCERHGTLKIETKIGNGRIGFRCPECIREGHRAAYERRKAGILPTPRVKKPPLPTRPCLCGCGEITAPGKRYRNGHHFRVLKKKSGGAPGLSTSREDRRLMEMMTSRMPCGWSIHAPARVAIEATREHQRGCPACAAPRQRPALRAVDAA